MSTCNIEGDIYIGYTGAAITGLDGESGGTLLANLVGRTFRASMGVRNVLRRNGFGADAFTSLSRGPRVPAIALEPRDVSAATLHTLFAALTNFASGAVRTSGANVATVGQVAPTIQVWGKRISGAANREVFAPAMVIAPQQQDLLTTWARDVSHYDGNAIILVGTRPNGQTTPAMAFGTNAELEALYFG